MLSLRLRILAVDDFLEVFKYHVVAMVFVVRRWCEGFATMGVQQFCRCVSLSWRLRHPVRQIERRGCYADVERDGLSIVSSQFMSFESHGV